MLLSKALDSPSEVVRRETTGPIQMKGFKRWLKEGHETLRFPASKGSTTCVTCAVFMECTVTGCCGHQHLGDFSLRMLDRLDLCNWAYVRTHQHSLALVYSGASRPFR